DVQVNRDAGALGAVITGVDLSKPLDEDTWRVIKRASTDHLVVCVRGQSHISPEDQIAFAEQWGEIWTHPYVPSMDGYPPIMRVATMNSITQTWHQDSTYAPEPPVFTMLMARTIPPYGGDTMFANAYLAYDNLSKGLKATLEGLSAVHVGTPAAAQAGLTIDDVTRVHPVVRVHPVTGRKSALLNSNYVRRFEGWTEAESAPLLSYLFNVIGRFEYTYRHRWMPGDIIIWDNRCTSHAVIGDTGGAERIMHRITIIDPKDEGPAAVQA
ncbi:MAG TPA: TauD/TfdA family dioxygenase, partial [Caulobacteraceae bacterium]|nr:TauD/TfdA family dioxygenase [Caulobacteraceae bacterium]